MIKLLMLVIGLAIASGAALAQSAPRLAPPRLYLIWERTGAMSKDMAGQRDQIVAVDRKLGASVQARLDAVVEGTSKIYENLTLGIRVTSEGKRIVDRTYPVDFIDEPGRMVRSVIVDHQCQPFDVELTLGTTRKTLKVDLTCGG
jgi:hypothetical protein